MTKILAKLIDFIGCEIKKKEVMISTPRLLSSHLSDLCKKTTTGGVLDLRFIVTLYATSSYISWDTQPSSKSLSMSP